MVKYVVDISQGVIAIGGEMQADAEAVLLDAGSRQQDLWGANYLPGQGPDHCIEFTSLINIRPSQGNRSMEITDPQIRARIRELTVLLLGTARRVEMSQHAGLIAVRWRQFTLDQQILMIANEMNRCSKLLGEPDEARRRASYERSLALVDLTIAVNERRTLRRELLRWRDVLAELYVADRPDPVTHRAAMRCLLRFTPVASQQVSLLAATR